MNFWKLSLAAAACGAVFASGAANATIVLGGDSELVLNAWDDKGTVDTADDTSYSRDLGLRINGFASSATNPVLVSSMQQSSTLLTFAADAKLANWLPPAGDRSRIRWNVVGYDNSGDQRLITTVATDVVTPSMLNNKLTGANIAANTLFSTLNSEATHSTPDSNGSAVVTSANGAAYAGSASWGDKLNSQLPFVTAAGMGSSLNWWLIDQNGSAQSNQVNKFQFQVDAQTPMQWTFANDGTLTYAPTAPIPEPGTWAMMLAGLAGLGLAARRRAR
jgi:hypothetical protein